MVTNAGTIIKEYCDLLTKKMIGEGKSGAVAIAEIRAEEPGLREFFESFEPAKGGNADV